MESNGVRTRGTTGQGEYRSHARMAMIEPISWDLIEEKVQPSPLPFLDPSTSARCAFAQDDTLRALFHYETCFFCPDLGAFVVSERNKMAVFWQLLAFGTGFAYVWA